MSKLAIGHYVKVTAGAHLGKMGIVTGRTGATITVRIDGKVISLASSSLRRIVP